jgi:hypothetical protein
MRNTSGFHQSATALAPGQVVRWRRKPIATVFLLLGLAVCLTGACILPSFDSGSKIQSWATVTAAVYFSFCFLRLLLVGRYAIEIRAEGIRFCSLATTRLLTWSDIGEIRWKYSRSAVEPLARSIVLVTGPSAEIIDEVSFVAGDQPLFDVILQHWQPHDAPRLSEDWLQNHCHAQLRRYGLLAAGYSLLTILTLSLLKAAGVLIPLFSWPVVVLSPIILLVAIGIIFGLPLARGASKGFWEYRDLADYDRINLPPPATIQSAPNTAIANSLFRRFFPPPPERLLSTEQVREIQHRMTRLDQEGTRLGFTLLLPLVAFFTYLPYRLNLLLQEPVVEPVLDTRHREGLMWLGAGLGLGLITSIAALNPVFTRKYGRAEMDLFSRYETTVKGYDTRRPMRYVYSFWIVFITLFCLFCWRNGKVVDKNGIRFKPGLIRSYTHTFDDVRSIKMYRRHNAPIGIQDEPSLQIDFREGPPLIEPFEHSASLLLQWQQAADYISKRSGIPIERGDIAPED